MTPWKSAKHSASRCYLKQTNHIEPIIFYWVDDFAKTIEEILGLGERIDRRQNLMVQEVRAGKPVCEVMHDTQFDAINKTTISVLEEISRTEPALKGNPKKASPEDEELVALFADSDTPGVSDALDKLGISGRLSTSCR